MFIERRKGARRADDGSRRARSRPGEPRIEGAASDDASLAETAYTMLTDELVNLSIPPGAMVSEALLSQRLGMGRTPVREAVKLVTRDYLVTMLPKRGILVSETSPQDMLLILETRRCLEPTRYARAARRSTRADRAEFAALADRLGEAEAAGDFRAQVRLDVVFDGLVDRCAGNRFLTDALKPLHGIVRRFWNMHAGTEGYHGVIQSHTALVRAVASGEPRQAAAACTEMLDYNETLLRQMLE
jgi:DNA-binding GntR family transcriptional regulator